MSYQIIFSNHGQKNSRLKTEWINIAWNYKIIENSLWCTRGFVAQGSIVPRLKWVIIKNEFYQTNRNVWFKIEVCSLEIFWKKYSSIQLKILKLNLFINHSVLERIWIKGSYLSQWLPQESKSWWIEILHGGSH